MLVSSETERQTDAPFCRKKEGHLVSLTAGQFTRSLITKEVFLEIKKLRCVQCKSCLSALSVIIIPCRTMVHPNVAVMYGCLVGNTNPAFLHAYCSRGTLKDVLNNKELELDWIFSLSFGLDAAEGMSYLHSKRIIHGRLSTSACMINEQWTLKIKGILLLLEYNLSLAIIIIQSGLQLSTPLTRRLSKGSNFTSSYCSKWLEEKTAQSVW